MNAAPVNEPATLTVDHLDSEFEKLTEAISYAVEEVDEKDRAHMVLVTKSGQTFHWRDIKSMYDDHIDK